MRSAFAWAMTKASFAFGAILFTGACEPQLSGEVRLAIVADVEEIGVMNAALFAPGARDSESHCSADGSTRTPIGNLELVASEDEDARTALKLSDDEDALFAS